ncbi:MAG: hypothetical protein QHC67_01375 [Sphingobium sp.]|uniref:hypothetical protein n=1 Tax=Sphingobium sp. TaxID=1912891 RepID=UPI0029AFA8B0|nr:hypothetical protein [Sphingobium sp.]MDX3908458.1 hypothetical protein [Sphingobium sp.]
MYKYIALFVLILSPVLVTLAENLTPSMSQHHIQDGVAPAAEPSPMVEQEAPPPVQNPASMTEVDPSPSTDSSAIVGQPMIDPKGIEPTPQWSAPASTGEAELPGSEAAVDGPA